MSKSQIPPKTSRLAISKSELESDHGRKLAKVLKQVLADGEITQNEIVALRKWLVEAGKVSNIAGINFLREEIESVLADGEIEQSEADLLVQSILRVLPLSERQPLKEAVSEAKSRRLNAKRIERELISALPTDSQKALLKRMGGSLPDNATKDEASKAIDQLLNRPTDKQKEYIQVLGGELTSNATKEDASNLIENLLLQNRPTTRQLMVLRFWDEWNRRKDGVEGVSEWLDGFYKEDPDRLLAWTLWKNESADANSRDIASVERIPLGVGIKYLERIKARKGGPNPHSIRVVFYSLSALIIMALVALIVWVAQGR